MNNLLLKKASTKCRGRKRIFILILLITSSFSVLLFYLMLSFYRFQHLQEQMLKSEQLLIVHSEIIRTHISDIINDVHIIAELASMKNYLSRSGSRKDLEDDMAAISGLKQIYDQIRYIDQKGMEEIRINLEHNYPSRVPLQELQNKKQRYYFLNTMSLEKGEIYISPFDLNIEHQKVEQPLKPMIRIGTPVFYKNHKPAGIIIVNYLGSHIIDVVKYTSENTPGQLYLINNEGYWLYRNNPVMEWGFMYDEKKLRFTIQQEFPDIWEGSQNSKLVQIHSRGQLVSLMNFSPYKNIDANRNSTRWYIMHAIPDAEFGLHPQDFRLYYGLLWAVILCLDIIVSLIVANIVYQRNKLRHKVEHLALYDNLTDLPNRTLILERLSYQLKVCKRYKTGFATLFIDLDGFKEINDMYGHKAGDLVLQETGKRLGETIRSSDLAGRYGGDEFIIILDNIGKARECAAIAEKIFSSLARELLISGKKIHIGASIDAFYMTQEKSETVDSILAKADSAMYSIKKRGKNGFSLFE